MFYTYFNQSGQCHCGPSSHWYNILHPWSFILYLPTRAYYKGGPWIMVLSHGDPLLIASPLSSLLFPSFFYPCMSLELSSLHKARSPTKCLTCLLAKHLIEPLPRLLRLARRKVCHSRCHTPDCLCVCVCVCVGVCVFVREHTVAAGPCCWLRMCVFFKYFRFWQGCHT